MGDRVSISFVNREMYKGREESVALFSHWGGMGFVAEAKDYAKKLLREHKGKQMMPLDRMEPNTVMVDFIRHLTKNMGVIESDYYLGKDGDDGDNCDNGHHKIDITPLVKAK